MKCAECEKSGLESRVQDHGGFRTLLGHTPFYDESGAWHSHDPNSFDGFFTCSNGHQWRTKIYNTCWCGWTNAPSQTGVET